MFSRARLFFCPAETPSSGGGANLFMIDLPPIDKSKWGPGPWQDEPDRVEFEHAGFPCLINRVAHSGSWCGYVAVPPNHPAFEKGYDDVDVSVHGGLTYANHCRDVICHIPKKGESENVWWLGFDCSHAGDGMPAMNGHIGNEDNYFSRGYKDIDYVKRETKDLAEQLAKMK